MYASAVEGFVYLLRNGHRTMLEKSTAAIRLEMEPYHRSYDWLRLLFEAQSVIFLSHFEGVD